MMQADRDDKECTQMKRRLNNRSEGSSEANDPHTSRPRAGPLALAVFVSSSISHHRRRRRRRRRYRSAAATLVTSSFAVLCKVLLVASAVVEAEKQRAWRWNPQDEHPCNIRRVTFSEFHKEFPAGGLPALYPTPIVVTTLGDYMDDNTVQPRNEAFRNLTTLQNLLENFPPRFEVTLSSSNSFSEHRRTVPFETYVAEMLTSGETLPNQLSNESWYLFGETYGNEWKPLLDRYELPPCTTCTRELVALSFGMGNVGSGVQWHVHGPGFSEAIHGRKHWVLYPPSHPAGGGGGGGAKEDPIPAGFDKDESSRQWMEHRYPRAIPKPLECTLNPGDFIYFPDRYWHATINLDPYTVFVSTFTTEHQEIGLNDEL